MTETAELADVVLPATTFAEKEGTFTNTERKVQRVRKAVDSAGDSRHDWKIICLLAQKMGKEGFSFNTPSNIMAEIASLTPIYGGMSYDRLQGDGLQWPCPDEGHPGTPILHAKQFSRGLGKFNPVTASDPFEQPDEEYPLILSTGRVLYHYHSGTMTRRSEPLAWRVPRGSVEIHPDDAETAGIQDGHAVFIESRRGRIRTKAAISDRVPPGTVFMAFHWREASVNILTHDIELDPVAKIPEYKICAVRLVNPRAGKNSLAAD